MCANEAASIVFMYELNSFLKMSRKSSLLLWKMDHSYGRNGPEKQAGFRMTGDYSSVRLWVLRSGQLGENPGF